MPAFEGPPALPAPSSNPEDAEPAANAVEGEINHDEASVDHATSVERQDETFESVEPLPPEIEEARVQLMSELQSALEGRDALRARVREAYLQRAAAIWSSDRTQTGWWKGHEAMTEVDNAESFIPTISLEQASDRLDSILSGSMERGMTSEEVRGQMSAFAQQLADQQGQYIRFVEALERGCSVHDAVLELRPV